MAMDRIHSLLEHNAGHSYRMPDVRWLRFHMISKEFTHPIPVFQKKVNKSCRIGPIKKAHPFGIFALISTLPYHILALFLVDNLALCTGLITVPNVALLTALHAARYPASSKRPFRVPLFGAVMLNVQSVRSC